MSVYVLHHPTLGYHYSSGSYSPTIHRLYDVEHFSTIDQVITHMRTYCIEDPNVLDCTLVKCEELPERYLFNNTFVGKPVNSWPLLRVQWLLKKIGKTYIGLSMTDFICDEICQFYRPEEILKFVKRHGIQYLGVIDISCYETEIVNNQYALMDTYSLSKTSFGKSFYSKVVAVTLADDFDEFERLGAEFQSPFLKFKSRQDMAMFKVGYTGKCPITMIDLTEMPTKSG